MLTHADMPALRHKNCPSLYHPTLQKLAACKNQQHFFFFWQQRLWTLVRGSGGCLWPQEPISGCSLHPVLANQRDNATSDWTSQHWKEWSAHVSQAAWGERSRHSFFSKSPISRHLADQPAFPHHLAVRDEKWQSLETCLIKLVTTESKKDGNWG